MTCDPVQYSFDNMMLKILVFEAKIDKLTMQLNIQNAVMNNIIEHMGDLLPQKESYDPIAERELIILRNTLLEAEING